MAWVMFDKFLLGQLDGSSQPNAPIDFDDSSVPMHLLLLDSGHEPSQESDEDMTDVIASAAEIAESNYARKVISSVTVTVSTNVVTVDASNPAVYAQHASGFSDARFAVLAIDAGADSVSPVICYADLGANKNNKSGSLTLQFSSAGIFTVAGA